MIETGDLPHVTRDERRRRTEERILDAAREAFAEAGFERTTIRGVAARAGIDPALVMQHFGSKEALFREASRWSTEHERALTAPLAELPEALLADAFAKFEEGDREAAVALVRNCLTHPTATRVMRDEVMFERTAAVAATIGGPDAELRAALVGACMMGLTMARHLIEVPALAAASQDDLRRVFAPVLAALVDPADQDG